MKHRSLFFSMLVLLAVTASTVPSLAQTTKDNRETLLAIVAAEPPNAPGMTLTTVIAEYKPGQFTPPHRHGNAFAMIYILEGTIVSKVDGKEMTLHKGDHFTENPNAHHELFRNSSNTQSTKVLAVFFAPSSEAKRDLTILDKQ